MVSRSMPNTHLAPPDPWPAVVVQPGELENVDAALKLELVPQGHEAAEAGRLAASVPGNSGGETVQMRAQCNGTRKDTKRRYIRARTTMAGYYGIGQLLWPG